LPLREAGVRSESLSQQERERSPGSSVLSGLLGERYLRELGVTFATLCNSLFRQRKPRQLSGCRAFVTWPLLRPRFGESGTDESSNRLVRIAVSPVRVMNCESTGERAGCAWKPMREGSNFAPYFSMGLKPSSRAAPAAHRRRSAQFWAMGGRSRFLGATMISGYLAACYAPRHGTVLRVLRRRVLADGYEEMEVLNMESARYFRAGNQARDWRAASAGGRSCHRCTRTRKGQALRCGGRRCAHQEVPFPSVPLSLYRQVADLNRDHGIETSRCTLALPTGDAVS
jgi:hypothetical protein